MIKQVTVLFALCMAINLGAQAENDLPALTSKSQRAGVTEHAELVLFSRPIAIFRANNQGISPADRVKRARTRIHDQVAKPGVHAVAVKSEEAGAQIQIDGVTSFVLLPGDLDPASETTLDKTAMQVAQALSVALKEDKESRSLETMLWALGKAFGATLAAYGVYRLIRRMRFAAQIRLVKFTATHSARLQVGGVALVNRSRLTTLVKFLVTAASQLFILILVVEWLSFTLRCFPFSRAWGESLRSYVLQSAMQVLLSAWNAIPETLTAAIIFFIGYLVSRAADQFFSDVRDDRVHTNWLDPDVATPTRRITKVVIGLFTLAMAYPYLPGSDTEAFKGLSVLVGLMLSMGASSLVGQAASGLILTYGRAFRKGEFVRVADQEGTVTEMGIFTTRIRTGLGEELTISNASILGSTTRNYSRAVKEAGFVLDTTVTIGYDTPWRQVHAMLIEAAKRTEGILHDPQPKVFQISLSDWYPAYRLVCQAAPKEPMPRAIILSDLHANIQDVFNEYGVQIMSPHYISDPAEPKVVSSKDWYAEPAEKSADRQSHRAGDD